MRALAEFVMRGRTQALWVSVLTASTLMFAWISAAVIALVTLRHGAAEGSKVLGWAALPASILLVVVGDSGPLSMILGTAALAAALRSTQSWSWVLTGASAVGLLTGLGLMLFGSAYLGELAQVFTDFIGQLNSQMSDGESAVQLQAPGVSTIAGMLGLANALTCVLCLLLARYWQALLYNPGGFREEFHGIRLGRQLATVLMLCVVGIMMLGVEYRPWAVLFAIPLTFAGLGFVHARTARRGLGYGWLSLFYVFWLLLDPVKLIVIVVAVLDSWLDFRGRWPQEPGR